MSSMSAPKQRVAKDLLKYANENMESWVQPIDKTRRFSSMDANSFLLGVLLDRKISADRAWEAGEWIAESMGDEENPAILWETLSSIEEERLLGFMRYGYGGKAFHRNYKTFARLLPKVARHILEKYDGDPRNIWNSQRDVGTVRQRLEELPGIGPALSRMAVLNLARNYGLLGGKQVLPQLDIKTDIHVLRVFCRTGLIESEDDKQEAISIAQELSPDFPAALDAPAWEIGQEWCRPTDPSCQDCPIKDECLQCSTTT